MLSGGRISLLGPFPSTRKFASFLSPSLSPYTLSKSIHCQVILNYQRKSVAGFHFDFIYLNILGYVCYSTYNCILYFYPVAQVEYCESRGPPNPVHLNDVFFSLHGLLLCLVQASQCFYYERGGQYVTLFGVLFGIPLWLWFEGCVFAWVGGGITVLKMIDWIAYVKLFVTFLKYCPQAWFNYRRKSTEGWSIHNILLDLTGGILSLLQGVIDWINSGNYRLFLGDPVKFGLSIISIFFDIIFIIQHYILYPPTKDSSQEEKIENEKLIN